jgi:hypothetical protein
LEKLPRSRECNWPVLVVYTLFLLWAAHACVFFIHEYAHSFTAWLLGLKSNPFALHYPRPTLVLFLIQLGINENVDGGAILASGHGIEAAIISAAGMVLGNALITFTLSRWGYAWAKKSGSRGWAMFAYWATVASVGNLLDYVPVRTFSSEGDMSLVQRGFGWSPWTVLVVLGIPTLVALIYFFARIEPATLAWLFPRSAAKRSVVAVLTAFAMFGFYGAAGLREGGPISHELSVISISIFFPLLAILGAVLAQHEAASLSLRYE